MSNSKYYTQQSSFGSEQHKKSMHANQTWTVEFIGVVVAIPEGVAPFAKVNALAVALPFAVRIAIRS